MTLNKTHLIAMLVGLFCGLVTGFLVGKGIYDRPMQENVTTDTVVVYKTVPDYTPAPKDSATIKYVTKWLPMYKTDTVENLVSEFIHDTVAVQVPITSKHYGNETYDAWVSGFEPNLDSIFVYNETQLITERITTSKPPNRFSIGLQGGYGYGFKSKTWEPYVGVGIGIRF